METTKEILEDLKNLGISKFEIKIIESKLSRLVIETKLKIYENRKQASFQKSI